MAALRRSLNIVVIGARPSLLGVLANRGHKTTGLRAMAEARDAVLASKPDAVLLAGSVDTTDLAIVRAWRREGLQSAIVVVTSATSGVRQVALAAGANDYLVAPYEDDEAAIRLETAARARPDATCLEFSDRRVDLAGRTVEGAGKSQPLTQTEADLLTYLAARWGKTVTADELLVNVWGYRQPVKTRAVANTIMRLRRKLEPDPKRPSRLLTVRGTGFKLVTDVTPAPEVSHAVGRLIGRDKDLRTIQDALAGQRAVLVTGPAGVGKSRTAEEALGGFSVVRCDLTTVDDVGAFDEAIRFALGLSSDPAGRGRHIEDALRAKSEPRLLLDGADGIVDHLASVLPAWLEAAPRLAVVVTSRRRSGDWHLPLVRLAPLAGPDARAVFLARAEGFAPNDDNDTIDRIVAKLDGLPLTLGLAASYLRHLDPRALDRQLASAAAAPGSPLDLDSTLRDGYGALVPAARSLLLRAALWPNPIELSLLESTQPPDAPWVVHSLSALCDGSLLEPGVQSGQFRMLDTVRAFALRTLADDPEGASYTSAHVTQVLVTGEAAVAALTGSDPKSALAGLARLRPASLAIRDGTVGSAPAARSRAAVTLAARGWFQGQLAGHVEHLLSATTPEDPVQRDALSLWRGRFLRRAGPLEAALAAVAEAASPAGELALAVERCFVLTDAARSEEAGALIEATLPLAWKRGDRVAEGRLLDRQGVLARRRGDAAEAARCHRRALLALEAAGARYDAVIASGNLALALYEQGVLDEAIERHQAVVDYADEVEDRFLGGAARGNLATVHLLQGETRAAMVVLREAVAVWRAQGFRAGLANLLLNWGGAELDAGRVGDARAKIGEALEIARATGALRLVPYALTWLGATEHLDGRPTKAVRHYQEADRVMREIDSQNPATLLHTLWALAEGDVTHPIPDASDERLAEVMRGYVRDTLTGQTPAPSEAAQRRLLAQRSVEVRLVGQVATALQTTPVPLRILG